MTVCGYECLYMCGCVCVRSCVVRACVRACVCVFVYFWLFKIAVCQFSINEYQSINQSVNRDRPPVVRRSTM